MSSASPPKGKRPPREPIRPSAPESGRIASSGARWLLLIHQIPAKPDYLRVKIGRRLQHIGAVPIKNSVYVLPPSPDAYEDFQWIVREIDAAGGDAFVSEASLLGEGLTDDDVRARFGAARDEEYRAILSGARPLLTSVRAKRATRARAGRTRNARADRAAAASGQREERELARLRRWFEAVSAIDFFAAPNRAAASAILAEIERAINQRQRTEERSARSGRRLDGATWVTRRDVHVDRIASAWLIRRFIDRRPRFRFADPKRYAHVPGELRFDMFEAEYTHVGDACTFETLVTEFVPRDRALRQIAEIVHDVDCKDAKFRREEAPGLARMVGGIVRLCKRDEDRLERGRALFDELYAAFDRTALK